MLHVSKQGCMWTGSTQVINVHWQHTGYKCVLLTLTKPHDVGNACIWQLTPGHSHQVWVVTITAKRHYGHKGGVQHLDSAYAL
jgi:hypothetical protein